MQKTFVYEVFQVIQGCFPLCIELTTKNLNTAYSIFYQNVNIFLWLKPLNFYFIKVAKTIYNTYLGSLRNHLSVDLSNWEKWNSKSRFKARDRIMDHKTSVSLEHNEIRSRIWAQLGFEIQNIPLWLQSLVVLSLLFYQIKIRGRGRVNNCISF